MTAEPGPFYACAEGVRVALKVKPNGGGDKIEGEAVDVDGHRVLKVSVTAIPEDGKANDAVIKLLAKSWHLPKTNLSIITGQTSRLKTVLIKGDAETLIKKLEGSREDSPPLLHKDL